MRDGHILTRILIADDHDVVRRGLRDILQDRPGWEVVAEASNGQDAISAALKNKPDIAIIDYALATHGSKSRGRFVCAFRKLRSSSSRCTTAKCCCNKRCRRARAVSAQVGRGRASDRRVHALVQRKPFFTGRVSEKLLQSFLVKNDPVSVLTPREQSVCS